MADDKNALQKTKELYRDGEERVTAVKALEIGVKYFDPRSTEIPADVLSIFSKEEVEKFKAAPVYFKNNHLVVGAVDPKNPDFTNFVTDLKKYFKNIEFAIISTPSFEEILRKYSELNIKKIELGKREDVVKLDIQITSFDELNQRLQKAPIQDLLKMVLFTAVSAKSSDIHIEPQEEDVQVRFRIDGILHEIARLEKDKYKVLLSQIELRSGIKIGAKFPQKGRFNVILEGEELSLRVETLPSLYGDDVVIRVFNIKAEMLRLSDLGVLKEKYEILREALARPHGMIIVVGPTGSGKTSTIYAILNEIKTPEIKIITLEDPVEYALKGATQSQINEGESFAERLKATLREDPDVIMVGEIRDTETAKTALQAALTGHMVITTIHANNAVTAITRMADLGGDPATLTTAANLLIAQRLVRKICDNCKEPYEPTDLEKKEAERILATLRESERDDLKLQFFKGKGCDQCNNLGYKGRVGIFELLSVTPALQKAIVKGITIFELQALAIEEGMMTMEQDGLVKVSNGVTTIQELMRAIKE